MSLISIKPQMFTPTEATSATSLPKRVQPYTGHDTNVSQGDGHPKSPATKVLDTIHHGIPDPPQLRMLTLDPTGSRPSDPMADSQIPARLSKEDRHRQQLNAVTDGIDPFNSAKNVSAVLYLSMLMSYLL